MIDFRYHLVSLISVFLALAVGIALGAGPLKESIGDTLTGQVDQLRSEKDQLRTDLDTTQKDLSQTQQFVDDSAPMLVAGALDGRRVAIISIGKIDDDEVSSITSLISAAGATVSAKVGLAPAWTADESAGFRQALVGNLTDYVKPSLDASATANDAIAAALVFALTSADPTNPDNASESASVVRDLLTSDDAPLVAVDGDITGPADAVIVLVEHAQKAKNSAATPSAAGKEFDALSTAAISLTTAAQQRASGAVLVDGPQISGSTTEAVAKDDQLTAAITTVAGVDDATGPVTTILALNASIGGTIGHYGLTPGRVPLPVRVELAPVNRAPVTTVGVPGAGG